MSSQQGDKEKIVSAFGGKKGLFDAGFPALVFLISFNITKDLWNSLIASVIISAVVTIIRLVMKDTIQHALSGFIGTLISAWFANRTGNPSDVFLPKLLTNLAYGSVYLIANLLRWPILGLMLGPILGENLSWRNDPARRAAYIRASWIWVGLFFGRLIVQFPIYLSDNVNLLGAVNLAMGYPLFFATVYGSWMVLKGVPTTVPPAQEEGKEEAK
jgi:hypothetical protein